MYCATPAIGPARARLGQGEDSAVLIDAGDPLSLDLVLIDLAERGVLRLMVEGGARVLGDFLARGFADELNLAVAPFFVADPGAPRLTLPRPSLPKKSSSPSNSPASRQPSLPRPAPRSAGPAPNTSADLDPIIASPDNPMTLAECGGSTRSGCCATCSGRAVRISGS